MLIYAAKYSAKGVKCLMVVRQQLGKSGELNLCGVKSAKLIQSVRHLE